jgi:hypothetical protein
MWTARIFASLIFAGVFFLLWFLIHLIHELPFSARRLETGRSKPPTEHRLELQNHWLAVGSIAEEIKIHSTWRYGVAKTSAAEQEPSCGTSSLYL